MFLWILGILAMLYLAISLLAKYNKRFGQFFEDAQAYYEHIPH